MYEVLVGIREAAWGGPDIIPAIQQALLRATATVTVISFFMHASQLLGGAYKAFWEVSVKGGSDWA